MRARLPSSGRSPGAVTDLALAAFSKDSSRYCLLVIVRDGDFSGGRGKEGGRGPSDLGCHTGSSSPGPMSAWGGAGRSPEMHGGLQSDGDALVGGSLV